MSITFIPFYFFFLLIINKHGLNAIPACIIIDTNMIPKSENELLSSSNNRSSSSSSSSSLLLRNLRMLDSQRSNSAFFLEPIPLSHIDIKQTTTTSSSPSTSTPAINLTHTSGKKSLAISPIADQTFSPCSIKLLNEIETQMVVPFEFRRLRLEQADHRTKFFDDDPRETVPDLSTAVYERRSDPEGLRFCRTCRDGFWTQLTICDTVRCDAELLRANPRLVTEWGEIKPLDGGILYAPGSVFAIYAFAFGPHCKRCEANGQWSRYALPELCSGIKFFGHPSTTTTTTTTTTTSTMKSPSTTRLTRKSSATIPLTSTKPINKKQ